jgi:hypothetical protein
MIKNTLIIDIITSKKFNLFIEYVFIIPVLYLIQYDYTKYSYITLFIASFILVKNLILMKITGLFNKDYLTNNKFPLVLIYKTIKMFIGIIFFFLQFKYKFAVKYNIWIANIFYLKYFIKFLSQNYSFNSIVKLKKQIARHINDFTN